MMFISTFVHKKKLLIFTLLYLSSLVIFLTSSKAKPKNKLYFIGPKVGLSSQWKGEYKVKKDIPILILAGHADSQGIAGAGTSGEAVDIYKKNPMDLSISDELFWNLRIKNALVKIGRESGLNISSYDPIKRNIIDGNDPKTNWSIGSKHNQFGGYALEIHFDSYREYGFGSGIIPAFSTKLNTIDEALASRFGRYPMFFRGGLGGPRRGIRILEIAKLEGELERNLRDVKTREETINLIAQEIIEAIKQGVNIN